MKDLIDVYVKLSRHKQQYTENFVNFLVLLE